MKTFLLGGLAGRDSIDWQEWRVLELLAQIVKKRILQAHWIGNSFTFKTIEVNSTPKYKWNLFIEEKSRWFMTVGRHEGHAKISLSWQIIGFGTREMSRLLCAAPQLSTVTWRLAISQSIDRFWAGLLCRGKTLLWLSDYWVRGKHGQIFNGDSGHLEKGQSWRFGRWKWPAIEKLETILRADNQRTQQPIQREKSPHSNDLTETKVVSWIIHERNWRFVRLFCCRLSCRWIVDNSRIGYVWMCSGGSRNKTSASLIISRVRRLQVP